LEKWKMTIYKTIKDARVPVHIWTDEIEDQAMKQLKNIAGLPFIHHHVAAMPDVHLGIGGSPSAPKG
jgi:tRNA-splicing ligase RtcB